MGRVETNLGAERPPRHLGGERRAAHAEQDDVVELLGRGLRERVQLVEASHPQTTSSQPSQRSSPESVQSDAS